MHDAAQSAHAHVEGGGRTHVGFAAKGEDSVAELVRQTAAPIVVDVDDRRSPRVVDLIEEDPLGAIVVLEIFVEVEVVLREVREDGPGEADAERPPERERVRRHFHHGVPHAGIDHLREPLLQHDGVGRGAVGDEPLVAGAVLDRPDESDRTACGVEDRLDHLRRRRFARRAGDADDLELVGRPPIEVRGDEGERGAGIIDFDRRIRRIAHDGDGPFLDRLRDEARAVLLQSGDGDEEGARPDEPRVCAHRPGFGVEAAVRRAHGHVAKEIAHLHSV